MSKIILKGNVSEQVNVPEGKTVELDLNGYKLSYTGTETNNLKATIKNEGVLTISDSSKAGNGMVEAVEGTPNTTTSVVANLGTLTINGGTLKVTCNVSNYGYYVINNAGSVVVSGGKVLMDENLAKQSINTSVIKNGNDDLTGTNTKLGNDIKKYDGKTASLIISGGEFVSPTYIKNCENGIIEVTGGTFTVPDVATASWNQSIFFNYGDLTISGGEFNTKTTNNTDKTIGPVWAGIWDAVPSKVTVTGGTFTMDASDVLVYTYVLSDVKDAQLPKKVDGFEISVSSDVAKKVPNVATIPASTKNLAIPVSMDVGGNTLDASLTAGNVVNITYNDGLIVGDLSRGTGNNYVSGKVTLNVMPTGTLVVCNGSEIVVPNGTTGTNVVNLGGTIKDTAGKTIKAEKKAVDGITTVEELNNALAIGADVENVDVTLKDKEAITVSGSTLSGTIKFGSDSVNFDKVKGDFKIYGGNSVDVRGNITGGTIGVTAGAVEIISGKVVADTTIIAASGATVRFSDVTVNSGVKLTLKGEGTFTVVADKAFNLYGSIANGNPVTAPATTPAVINVIVPEDATFKAYSGSQIAGTIFVTGSSTDGVGTIDLTQAQNPQSVGEDISYDKTYGQLENVTVVGSLTIKNNSTVTVKGGFQVNEGVTVTIEKGSKLIIDSLAASMIVDGRIVVEEGATLEVKNAKDVKVSGSIDSDGTVVIDSKVTIKSGGAITINDGTVAKPTAAVTGADKVKELYGSVFEPKKGLVVEAGATLTVKSLMYSADAMNIENKGTVIFDKAIIGTSASGNVDVTVKMLADGAVVQIISIENIATIVDEKGKASEWQNNGLVISDLGLKVAKDKPATSVNSVAIKAQGYAFKGLTVVEKVTSYTDNTGNKQYNNDLDLAGAVSVSKIDEASTPALVFSVSGDRIAITGELTLGKNVVLTVTDKKVSVTGKLVATEEGSKIANSGEITVTGLVQVKTNSDIGKINAAMYESKIGTTTVYNYTTLKAAIDSGAKDITVSGIVYVTESVTVPAGVTIKNNGEIVVGSADDTEVVLTVADTASIKYGKVIVKGTLYFENKKDNKTAEIESDVSVIGEKDARYTNLFTALNNANAGETVTVDKAVVDLKKSITIKEGVTLDVPNSKALKVYAGVTITVNGTLKTAEKIETATFTKTDGTVAQVTFDLAADKLNGKAAIIVNGVFMSGVEFSYNGAAPAYMIPGAYYSLTDDAGAYNYVTTLENASKTAATSVTVYGKVSAGDVVFTGTDSEPKAVVVAAKAELTVSSITLDKTTFTVNAAGKFTGDVKAGDAAVSVKLVKDMAVSVDKDGLFTVEGATAADKTSSFKVSAGSVYIDTASMNVTVSAGATLVSAAAGTVLEKDLTIEGTVTVANEQTITVNGNVIVKGALSVADATDSKIAGTFNAEKNLYIGLTSKDVTGDAASVSGAVYKVQVAFVKADATVSEATIDSFKVNGVLKSTTYVVEGKDWITVYDRTGNYLIKNVTEAPFENAEFKDEKWLNTDGKSADNSLIGASKCDKVTANINYEIYRILVNPAAGIESIAVDGNLMIKDSETGMYGMVVKAGTHEITCKLANGYSGEAKFAIVDSLSTDGMDATLNGNKVTVSGDAGVVGVQITGVEKSGYVDPTPVVPEEKDDGMSLTDILLIVLVVLIVIMAVIVAMRLMRS